MSALSARKRFFVIFWRGLKQFAHSVDAVGQRRGAARVLQLDEQPVICVGEFLAFSGAAVLSSGGDCCRLAGERAVIWRNAKWSKDRSQGSGAWG